MYDNIKMLHDSGWVNHFDRHYGNPLSNLILNLASVVEKRPIIKVFGIRK